MSEKNNNIKLTNKKKEDRYVVDIYNINKREKKKEEF